ncbi:11590_t:CDS:2, partial [Funneliformis geosporum]
IDGSELRKKGKLKGDERLDGSLKIEDFTNLKKFSYHNMLINGLEFINCPKLEIIECTNITNSLNIQNLPNLKKLDCSQSYLSNLDLSNNIKLEQLNLSDNDFQKQTLSFLSHLINLESLNLKNTRIGPHARHNKFYGSLKPLNISDTDIDRGLEYLPIDASPLCEVNVRDNAKVKYLAKEVRTEELSQQKAKEKIRDSLPKLMGRMPYEDLRNSVGSGEELDDSVQIKLKSEIKEKIVGLLPKMDEVKSMEPPLKNQLSELETTFEQKLKGQEEIEGLQSKVADYKNLEYELKASRDILNMKNMEEIIENEDYLNDSLQELQKEDNEPILEKAKARLERAEEAIKNTEEQSIKKLKDYINDVQELTKKLLDNQQTETQEESSLSRPSTPINLEDTVARKEGELERKRKMFDVYVKKSDDEKMEKVEEEITRLEEEISKLKLEQRQQQVTQIEVEPK